MIRFVISGLSDRVETKKPEHYNNHRLVKILACIGEIIIVIIAGRACLANFIRHFSWSLLQFFLVIATMIKHTTAKTINGEKVPRKIRTSRFLYFELWN
jgi:hypothetical protein